MRRLAPLLAVLGILSLAGAAAVGLTGVEIDVRDSSYDCGSAVGRLGGDDRERDWALEGLGINEGDDQPDVPEGDLPQVACKDATDDRLTPMYALVGLGLLLLVAAGVALWLSRRRVHPQRAPDDGRSRGAATS